MQQEEANAQYTHQNPVHLHHHGRGRGLDQESAQQTSMGIPPRNATLNTLITRPRMASPTYAWTSEEFSANTIIIAAPPANSSAVESGRLLERPNPALNPPSTTRSEEHT